MSDREYFSSRAGRRDGRTRYLMRARRRHQLTGKEQPALRLVAARFAYIRRQLTPQAMSLFSLSFLDELSRHACRRRHDSDMMRFTRQAREYMT